MTVNMPRTVEHTGTALEHTNDKWMIPCAFSAMVAGPEGLPAPLFCKDNPALVGSSRPVARQWDTLRGGKHKKR